MRILLANLPWIVGKRLGVRAGSRWPFTSPPDNREKLSYIPFPFFLAYSAALLKREKKEVLLIDAVAEGSDDRLLISKAKYFSPGLIAIETSTPSFKSDMRLIGVLARELPEARIALCGTHASIFSQDILRSNDNVRYVLCGEYEYTLLELVHSLENGLDLDSVAGLVYRRNGEVRRSPASPEVKDLDSLPWPERENLPMYNYNDAFAGLPVPNVQMLSSRGCPFKCNFCLWPQALYSGYRTRDPVKVAEEMEYLVGHFGFKAVYFDDDTFNADKDHLLGVCRQIRARDLKVPWAIMARPDLMDKEMLEELLRSGLYAVKYGIESADDSVLKASGKELDLARSRENILLTRKMGIKVHLTFCLGLIGETRESIEKTLRLKEELSPDSFQFSLAVPFPGTGLFEQLKKKGMLSSQDWDDYDGSRSYVIKAAGFKPGELEALCVRLNSTSP